MKKYLKKNVYECLQDRLKFIFENFDNIYVSFSGGKDSGLLLNSVLDYKRKHNNKKIGVFHQDFEAQYDETTQFVTRMFQNNIEDIEPFWVCLPVASRCAVSNFQIYWYPWEQSKKDIWVRDMPDFPYIINEQNNPFNFYKYKQSQEDFYADFSKWFSRQKSGKSIGLIGIRANESLNRYRAYANVIKETIDGRNWTTKIQGQDNMYIGYPLYDWTTEDIWIANGKFDYDYNKIYDLFWKAGLFINQMRVASPYHESARHSLNLYRIIEPQTWAKIVGRVNGANFGAIYGGTKALGYREITLPAGHTWRSYTKFLLATLPEETRINYIEKFITSIKFWNRQGGVVNKESIEEIEALKYNIELHGASNRSKYGKQQVIFHGIPDDTDDVKSTIDIPSWKRMAFCILKNDHLCKFMGFGQSKKEVERAKELVDKYKNI